MHIAIGFVNGVVRILDTETDFVQDVQLEYLGNNPILGVFRNSAGDIVEVHPAHEPNISRHLVPYINNIKDPELREFTMQFRRLIPEYFFHVPASRTGKYHPPCNLGEGGLLRHTIFVCTQFKNITEIESTGLVLGYTQEELDLMYIACIFHDFLKQGWEKSNDSYKNHAKNAAEAFRMSRGFIKDSQIDFIAHCIESHMGQWDSPTPQDKYQWLVHLADYMASRNNIEMFGPNSIHVLSTQKVIPVDRVNEYTEQSQQSNNTQPNKKTYMQLAPTDKICLAAFLEKQMLLSQIAAERYNITRPIAEIRSIIEHILKYNGYTDKQKRYIDAVRLTMESAPV